ncbi:UNVERIFIED_CONTAM: hypothetical protein HDU68_001979 [Siphonaria sp. JEL0065]|nr:hypothetical protein HDU68_001979 [Siphonaria sp. JEL0065]
MPTLISHRLEMSDTQHRGTIRYEGEIEGKQWFGVEWDDPSRGKHSGQHPKDQSTFLFRVSFPNSASFVRADSQKVLVARTFLAAVRERYVADNSEELKVHQNSKSSGLRTRAPNEEVEVEMVGWEKMRQKLGSLQSIKILGLAGMQIGFVDDAVKARGGTEIEHADVDQASDALFHTFPLVEDLDLSRNLFSLWEDVARITKQLPQLESLRLNSNRLSFSSVWDSALLTAGFGNLKVLALNSTNIAWDDIETLAPYVPLLESLFIGFNNLTSVNDEKYPPTTEYSLPTSNQQTAPLFPNLTAFHLDQNKLTSWTQLCHLIHTHMPKLTTLNLSNNQISDIQPSSITTVFKHLTTLNLTCNNLTSYSSIHTLNSFPVLVDIRVRDNPCLSVQPPSKLDSRSTTVATTTEDSTTTSTSAHVSKSDELTARLTKATRINGKVITPRDRSDAELYYMGKVAQWIHGLRTTSTSISAAEKEALVEKLVQEFHPRYRELCGVYGEPEVAPASVTSNALKDRLVVLAFCLFEGGDVEVKRVEKKVPLTMTLRALRALVGRVLGVRGGGFRMRGVGGVLEAEEKGSGTNVVELEEEMREVGFFDFVNGDEIHVFV